MSDGGFWFAVVLIILAALGVVYLIDEFGVERRHPKYSPSMEYYASHNEAKDRQLFYAKIRVSKAERELAKAQELLEKVKATPLPAPPMSPAQQQKHLLRALDNEGLFFCTSCLTLNSKAEPHTCIPPSEIDLT